MIACCEGLRFRGKGEHQKVTTVIGQPVRQDKTTGALTNCHRCLFFLLRHHRLQFQLTFSPSLSLFVSLINAKFLTPLRFTGQVSQAFEQLTS